MIMATPRKSSGEITMGLAVSKEKVQVFTTLLILVFTSFYRDGLIEHGKSKVQPPQFPVSTASEASEAVIFVRRRGEKEPEGLVLADCGDWPRHQLQGRSRNRLLSHLSTEPELLEHIVFLMGCY